jgi:hypothetical protein
MIVELNSETHPKAEVVAILMDRKTVDFRWVDGVYNGVCNCPYTSMGDIPTEADLKAAIESVL